MSNEPRDPGERVRVLAVELCAMAENGLRYTENPFDRARYERLADVGGELLEAISGHPSAAIRAAMALDGEYVTPKVDVRAALFDESERVLMMRERIDGRWSLPGGWCDPGDTPAEAAEREMLEEAGHPVRAVKLAALLERDRQGHAPRLPMAVYKLYFVCETAGEPRPPQDLETLELGWFDVEDPPPLSEGRILAHQLRMLREHHRDRTLPTAFE